ncbi:DUF4199 domain-containing protein [Arundinibacter roseus]|uniref:DUF4199 domain-containing protein n=1 Tax=Arundinibacter roseus TaxID=2070510 RepID=A0A4R4KGY0_9BACT|nr:DUF4199 domain-containing protein [Arundinibacter roseus]TDB65799.1 DUF4199 domain-containing protein [Arundinibacter roseus]
MQEQVSTARIALKFGIITAVAVIVYSTIVNLAGLVQNRAVTSLSFVIMIIGIVLAMRDFRTQNAGYMSYGEGLGIGSLVSAIVGLLGSVFTMFYMEFIDTTIIQQSMDKAREDMENRGMDDAQIEQAIEMSEKFMTPGMMFFLGIISYLIIGFLLSLIISAIMRKNKPVFE